MLVMIDQCKFIEHLRRLIQSKDGHDLSQALSSRACVAVILRGKNHDDLEIGYIRRAESPGDRWSGQIAFPGGLCEECDASEFDAALREVREELGIELRTDELLGRLDDLQARNRLGLLPFFIRPFVFHVGRDLVVNPDPSEVAEFFWFPLRELIEETRRTQIEIQLESGRVSLPAVRLFAEPHLWGLTLMMTQDLVGRLKS
jgi:8-oxo-dGTP pyrophosphatase MutT (NUDIX family)